MPRYSIIIPSYNRADFLAQALASVQAQTIEDYEVIVVDDGSTDGSPAAARGFARTRVIEQRNAGPGAARNRGIAAATGAYVLFLDSDDMWFPWTLATLERALAAHGNPEVVSGAHVGFSAPAELAGVAPAEPVMERYEDLLGYVERFPSRLPHTSTMAVRRDVLRATGGFLEERVYAEDTDLFLKLGAAKGFVKITAPFTSGVRRHEDNISHDVGPWILGLNHLMKAERSGAYPGGRARRRQRRAMITFPMRACTLRCTHQGRPGAALGLYCRSFIWHVGLGRYKFLALLPVLILLSALGWRGGKANAGR